MDLTKTLKKTELDGGVSGRVALIYSPKLGKEIPINSEEKVGEIQEYNIGLAPGSWY